MKAIDLLLSLLIPSLVLVHLLIAPYTKVEESFNIQAIHDIVTYGPVNNLYDHVYFPGAVPRTFVGALLLAGISKPLIYLAGAVSHQQLIVRAVLGLFNAGVLLRYKICLDKAFGSDVGRWYLLLQAGQFHVIYYASRTLPNMFAFGLTTLAFCEFLPLSRPSDMVQRKSRQRLGIYFLVLAGVVFRAELAVLLFTQVLYLLVQSRISLQTLIPAGLLSAIASLAISVPIDSYFWQRPIWPEFAGFYFNAVQGKSADWGTSPYMYYFSNLLPRLLLNPLILIPLVPLALTFPSTMYPSADLVAPSTLFIAIYSLQAHKESRFIIYVVPPLTAAASLSASYIWTRRSKTILYRGGSLLLVASVILSLTASTFMLLVSSLNYPGGDAMSTLHSIIKQSAWQGNPNDKEHVRIHMDVLSCMTGITQFQEIPGKRLESHELPIINGRPTVFHYDKTEDEKILLEPDFWAQFDYVLMEDPGKAIGDWEVVATVSSYAGIEVLRPGDGIEELKSGSEAKHAHGESKLQKGKQNLDELRRSLSSGEISRSKIYMLIRDTVRLVTGGWWVGPRMEPSIRILKQVKDQSPG